MKGSHDGMTRRRDTHTSGVRPAEISDSSRRRSVRVISFFLSFARKKKKRRLVDDGDGYGGGAAAAEVGFVVGFVGDVDGDVAGGGAALGGDVPHAGTRGQRRRGRRGGAA